MNLVEILLIAALVVFVVVRRFGGAPLRARSLVIPLIITVWGVSRLFGHPFSAVDAAVLAVDVLLGLGAGAARGLTIQVYERDGHLWQRYRWTTLVVWILTIAVRIGLAAGGNAIGANVSTNATVMLLVGASFLAEALVVGERARRTGVPFAPARGDRDSMIRGR